MTQIIGFVTLAIMHVSEEEKSKNEPRKIGARAIFQTWLSMYVSERQIAKSSMGRQVSWEVCHEKFTTLYF